VCVCLSVCSAVGCADLTAPPNTTVVRDADRLTVRCNHSEQIWYLVCINASWHGETINCNNGFFLPRFIHVYRRRYKRPHRSLVTPRVAESNSEFVRCMRWAGTFASGGRRTVRNTLMRTMGRCHEITCTPRSAPYRVRPCAQHIDRQTDRQTETETHRRVHATYVSIGRICALRAGDAA